MDRLKKLKRLGSVISILSKYGFDDIVSRTSFEKYYPKKWINKNSRIEQIIQLTVYERIRLALEELGPAYVKFGQTFSNREDLIPLELILELEKLQDKVPAENININELLAKELNINPDDYFKSIKQEPIASASISQVYEAYLIDGTKVVLKIKRSNIDKIIKSDILLMKDLANILENKYEQAKRMNLSQIVNSFQNSVLKELSFRNELSNIERFRNNFKNSNDVYVPKTYKELSNNNILCMEFVEGDKINNKQKLIELGLNPVEVADKGLNLFMKQIFEDGFFHADPHPGNVFMLKNKKIAFIDFGSMGIIMPSEKENLEELIINFITKDAKRIIKCIKRIAITYEIEDEKLLERDIYNIFEILDSTSLNEIDVTVILELLKSILAKNNVLMPEYMYLLMRGISLIEGIGKQLNPNLNITKSIKPYALKLTKKRYSPKRIAEKSIKGMRTIVDGLQNLPDDLILLMEKTKDDKLTINHRVDGFESMRKTMQNAVNRLVYAIIIAALSIGSSILIMAKMPPLFFGVPFFGFLGFMISGILGIVIIISIWKKDK